MTDTNDPYSGMNEQPGYQPPPGAAPVGPPPGAPPVGPPPGAPPVGPPPGQGPVGAPPGAAPVGPPPGQAPQYSPPPASVPMTPPVETPTSTDVWGADPTQVLPTAPAPYQAPPEAYPGTGYQAEIPQESSSQKGRIIAFAAVALIALGGIGFGVFTLLGGDSDDGVDIATETTIAADGDATDATDVATTDPDTTDPDTTDPDSTEPSNDGLPADAPTFVDVFDGSGYLFATVPDDWVIEGQEVSGSENLKATGDQGELLMFPLITEVTPAEQMIILIDGWECTLEGDVYDYDDGLFVGVGAKYTCDGSPKYRGEALVVTHPEGDRILVDTFMTGGDEANLIRKKIFDSFNLKLG